MDILSVPQMAVFQLVSIQKDLAPLLLPHTWLRITWSPCSEPQSRRSRPAPKVHTRVAVSVFSPCLV